jgi:hypothetical protein
MSKLPDADNLDAKRDLESAFVDIRGVAEVLMELGTESEVSSYLGGQLKEHYDAAMDAFRRAFKLDEYKPDRAAEAMAAAPPPDVDTRQALRKLIDKWDAEAGEGDDGGNAA